MPASASPPMRKLRAAPPPCRASPRAPVRLLKCQRLPHPLPLYFRLAPPASDQLVELIGDLLCGLSTLFHDPVGGAAFDYVLGTGVVDQPLGRARGEHQPMIGDGDDEAVTKRVEPEHRPASAAHQGVQFASRRVTSNPLVPTRIARRAIRGYWCGHAIIVALSLPMVVRVQAAAGELVACMRPLQGDWNKMGTESHASMNDAALSPRAPGRRGRPVYSQSRSA